MSSRRALAALADAQHALAGVLRRADATLPDELAAQVIPGGRLDVAGALDVYRNGYFARLAEQLGETYASVWRVLGDERFFALCRAYIATHPSSSYNLSDYGREFPAWLEGGDDSAEWPMLPELARFELVFHDLFHAPSHRGVPAQALAALGDLAGARLRLAGSVRLLALERAVYDVFRHRNDEDVPAIDIDRPQWVVLFKQDSDVLAREIDRGSFVALQSLAAGQTVEDALASAAQSNPAFSPAEVAKLFELIGRYGLVEAQGPVRVSRRQPCT